MALTPGQEIEVQIEKLVYGGSGLARYNDLVIFVPYTSPGERCLVKITKQKKSYAEALKLKTLESGPNQREAPCKVFGLCGACHWQSTDYNEQLRQKQLLAKEALRGLYDGEIPIVYAEEWHYRNRIQVRGNSEKIGFYKKASHEIIDAKNCLISRKEILASMEKIRSQAGKDSHKYEIYIDKDKQIHSSIDKKHAEVLGFSQVNEAINDLLQDHVSTLIYERNAKLLYDLYCGKGNFSFAIKKRLQELNICAVDLSQANIAAAKEQNEGVDFVCADVLTWMNKVDWQEDAIVLIDPPRVGASKDFMTLLAKKAPKSLIYVSCNPSTLRRDLVLWQSLTAGYKISSASCFDMFPQTYHFEMVIVLDRK